MLTWCIVYWSLYTEMLRIQKVITPKLTSLMVFLSILTKDNFFLIWFSNCFLIELCTKQGGRGQLTGNYAGPLIFINTFSHWLAYKLWLSLSYFNLYLFTYLHFSTVISIFKQNNFFIIVLSRVIPGNKGCRYKEVEDK